MSRDEQILQAALQLFYKRGFHAVGVDEIGTVAGVTGPAIYRHFAGKQELLSAIFDRSMDLLIARTGSISEEDPRAEVELRLRRHAEFVVENPELAVIYSREDYALEEPHRRRWKRRQRPYFERFAAAVQRYRPEASPSDVKAAAWVALHVLTSQPSWPREQRSPTTTVDLMVRMAMGTVDALGD